MSRCSGSRLERCSCKYLYKDFPDKLGPKCLYLAKNYEFDPKLKSHAKKRNNTFVMLLEKLYDQCAEYNLRYCTFRRYPGNKNNVLNTLKDFLILCCFLIANFVILLTIVTKMTVHVACVVLECIRWLRKKYSDFNTGIDCRAQPSLLKHLSKNASEIVS